MKLYQFLSLIVIGSVVIAAAVGCDSAKPETEKGASKTSSGEQAQADGTVHEEGHEHGAGPHGGVIADWGGGKYHVEFTVDHEKQEATVYILGDDAKTALSIDAAEVILAIVDPAFQVALTASPQTDDSAGKSSRFIGKHESLSVVQDYVGSISGMVGGTPYSGNFNETAHDH